MASQREEALDYHASGRPGKVEVIPTKPCRTQGDLSLAYTPGVAEPCRAITEQPEAAYRYTAKGNLVAVVTNGTAVLGLGNIGALAGKPVMEGKGVLFKRFADIDVFDIELQTESVEEFIQAVRLMEPTFGGINLEDVKAPECFEIETALKEAIDIPVFHDDQHGTAIISAAALINALDLADKSIDEVRIVISGAGAAGIACARIYHHLGAKKEKILLVDSKGVISQKRVDANDRVNEWKAEFAVETDRESLSDAMEGADVFLGCSVGGIVSKEMVRSMADTPIIFACANPDPEITYDDALDARSDVIMATGRSDYPNQVNNVLGFPFIFRGALDVRARNITMNMKVAAAEALANLAREDVPDAVSLAYGGQKFQFGREYIIPKPFDDRVLFWVAPAVAKAAMEDGVARKPIDDFEAYRERLKILQSKSWGVLRPVLHQAKADPKRVVFPEGDHPKILRACQRILEEEIARPILLGDVEKIQIMRARLGLELDGVQIIDPDEWEQIEDYTDELYELRQRKGVTRTRARQLLSNPNYFAAMMVNQGDADCLIAGISKAYPWTLRPALQIIKVKRGVNRVAGLYMVIMDERILFLADTTVNISPTARDLADIAILSADTARYFISEPRVAMLSFSNFGDIDHPEAAMVREATQMVKARRPDLVVDGEMQADTAVTTSILQEFYPFADLDGDPANVLIFPNLSAANMAYKLLQRLTKAEVVGPILMGMKRPVHVVQQAASVEEIRNLTAFAVVEAQRNDIE